MDGTIPTTTEQYAARAESCTPAPQCPCEKNQWHGRNRSKLCSIQSLCEQEGLITCHTTRACQDLRAKFMLKTMAWDWKEFSYTQADKNQTLHMATASSACASNHEESKVQITRRARNITQAPRDTRAQTHGGRQVYIQTRCWTSQAQKTLHVNTAQPITDIL